MAIRTFTLIALAGLCCTCANAYQFWGITAGTELYEGSPQLTFSGVAGARVSWAVGGYKYTRVDSTWYGAFEAAAPGAEFLASRRSDAQGLFFRADADAARFVIITGSNQNGSPAPECGTGTRLFGPGDLKIDAGGHTYGVGLRLNDLLWAVDPFTTNPEFIIHTAGGGTESIYARDAGTLGRVERDPRWARVGHSTLPASSDKASAFYLRNSGIYEGGAVVSFADTGLYLAGARVYAYEVAVPWSTLGLDPAGYSFTASWRPDCGNDLISLAVEGSGVVPEPASLVTLLLAAAGIPLLGRRG